MMRVGFVGTENSHVKHFIRFLNLENLHPDHRAVALAGGEGEQNRELAEFGGIETIVDEAKDLVDHVDAVIICNRDGGLHRPAAEPFLRAGIPVLVDKPLTASVEDARALLDLSQETGTRLFSASALRFVPEMAALRDEAQGPLRHLHVAGPADPDSEYAGIFFYGIHHVEAAMTILGDPVVKPGDVDVTATRHGDTVVAHTRIADVDITFTFVVPGDDGRVPFHATAIRAQGITATELTLGGDYNAPALDAFFNDTMPLDKEQLLSPIVVLEAIAQAIS